MAGFGSWVVLARFIFGLCALIFALEHGIFAGADDAGSNVGGPEECRTDLTSVLPPPYSNISQSKLICMTVWNTFVLRHYQSEDGTLTIMLSAVYTTGWVGIGFSKDGLMVGSSAMVGWFNKKGQPKIMQYYLQGTVASKVKPGKGELPLTGVPAAVGLHSSRIYVAFQLKLSKPLARQPVILAFGIKYPKHHRLTHHVNKTSIYVDFVAGSASPGSKYVRERKRTHGALALIGWGLILPTGAIVARYFRHKDPQWYYIHTITQFIGFIIGLAAVVVGLQLYSEVHPDIPNHRGIGIFVLVLTILQILAFFLRPDKDSKFRGYWNWYHSWVGRLTLFFAAINIVLGIEAGHARDEWKIGYGFLVSLVIVAVIVLEVLFRMKRKNSTRLDVPSAFQMNPLEEALPNKDLGPPPSYR